MAKTTKKSKLDIVQDLESNKEEIIEDIIIPAIDNSNREMILDLRAKGFDDNRIAARLMIQKSIVENTK